MATEVPAPSFSKPLKSAAKKVGDLPSSIADMLGSVSPPNLNQGADVIGGLGNLLGNISPSWDPFGQDSSGGNKAWYTGAAQAAPGQRSGADVLGELLNSAKGIVGQVKGQADQSTKAQSSGGDSLDPLALHLYFASTIAPLLTQIQNQQNQQLGTYQSAMGNLLNNVQMPANMKGIMQANMATQIADTQKVNNTNAAAAATAPFYDQLMGQVNAARQSQLQAYMIQKAMEAQQAAGLTGAAPASGAATTSGF